MNTLACTSESEVAEPLAILGGPKLLEDDNEELFYWPIITEEDETAVLDVLRQRAMSKRDIVLEFEKEWALYNQTRFALSLPSGTMAVQVAMWAAGLGRGDEVICPTITYWASALPAFSLGSTVVFADIDANTLCIDPQKIERHIGPRTKAIVCVHYAGHPCDMDAILGIARKHDLKVIEDASHAHGSLYKGRKVGTFGDVTAMSMMGSKAFAIGEAGMLLTDDREIYERALAFCNHYRNQEEVTIPALKRMAGPDGFVTGLPLGGLTSRLNQTCAAMGRVQLKHYPRRIAEIGAAMQRFWGLLEGIPGVRPHCTQPGSGSTMGAWYNALGRYFPDELGGLPLGKFVAAIQAEGGYADWGINFPLHLHPAFNEADIYRDGKPTRIAFSERDVRQPAGSLPVAESIVNHAFWVPWFKQDAPEWIERHAAVYRKVALQAHKL